MASYWVFQIIYRLLTPPRSGLKWLRFTLRAILRRRKISATGSGFVLGFKMLPYFQIKTDNEEPAEREIELQEVSVICSGASVSNQYDLG